MSICMCCKRQAQIFIVTANESLQTLIINLLGSMEQYITPSRGICASCSYLIYNIFEVRRCIFDFMKLDDVVEESDKNSKKFIKMYDTFIQNLQTTKYDTIQINENVQLENDSNIIDNDADDGNLSPRSNNSSDDGIINESDLLLPMYSKPNKIRRSYKTTYSKNVSREDKEIVAVFQRKPRRKNHNWSRKKRTANRSQSVYEGRRSISSLSVSRPGTTQSMYHIPATTTYVEHTLTREDIIYNMFKTLNCIDDCPRTFMDLEALTKHKIEDHKLLAKFWCYECHLERFTSEKDLNIHKLTVHKVVLSHCILCSEVLPSMLELKYHLSLHKFKSVPCPYCEKTFLSENNCNTHIKEYHQNMKNCEKRIKEPIIRTIYSPKPAEPLSESTKSGEVIFKELQIVSVKYSNNNYKSSVNKNRDVHKTDSTRSANGFAEKLVSTENFESEHDTYSSQDEEEESSSDINDYRLDDDENMDDEEDAT